MLQPLTRSPDQKHSSGQSKLSLALRHACNRGRAGQSRAGVWRQAGRASTGIEGLPQLDQPLAAIDHDRHFVEERVEPLQELPPGHVPSPYPNHHRGRPTE